MQIRLCLACACGLRPMLETKPPLDQEQAKNQNLYIIFFGGGVTIHIYLLSPMSVCVTNFRYQRLSPTPVTLFLNSPLFYSAISELNCILTFFYSDYYDFFWVQYAFSCSSYFLPQPILSLKVTKWKVLL